MFGIIGLLVVTSVAAQDLPLVYDSENTGIDCPEGYTLAFEELPAINSLPDPFEWSDGRGRLENISDWRCRRNEISDQVQFYEVGKKPVDHDSLTASYNNGVLTVNVYRNGHVLTLRSNITLPAGSGPFPAIIGMGSPTGSLPSSIFTSRDIAQITFNFGDVMAHTQTRGNEPINEIYPELEYMGAYSAWPWGVSRLIDGLELVADEIMVDTEHLGVTGCSFAGKMALYSGAFDERIALTIAQESGGGGYTTWRYSETLGNVERIQNTSYAWFINDLKQFQGTAVSKLPFDHHELMAMVAPRALLVTGNPDYEWLADESGHVGSQAAKKVWEALNIPDRFGYSIVSGHSHCVVPASQIPEIESFVDRYLKGDESVTTQVATTPYNTNVSSWIPWDAPELGSGTSYFGRTSITYPEDKAGGTDTTITFSWEPSDDAVSYNFELSEKASFSDVVHSENVTSTELTIEDLTKGERYYWRIQVVTADGSAGPWTSPATFITYIKLPPVPELESANIYRASRPNYYSFRWMEMQDTESYLIQLATDSLFNRITVASETNSTAATLLGTEEGKRYYWRVKGMNIAGESDWSETRSFFVLAPADRFEVNQVNGNSVELSWNDNSRIEDGYIIRRMVSPDTTFTTIDTLASNVEEYIDPGFDGNTNYTYHVLAYYGDELSDAAEYSATLTSSETEVETPAEISLFQNYPNPFNPSTVISYQLAESGDVALKIFDTMGREVAALVNRPQRAGLHAITFDASGLSSGTYFYQLKTGDFIQSRKMILLK